MITRRDLYCLMLLGAPLFASPLTAQQGGCVLSESAPIYASDTGDKVEFTASKGDCVGPVNEFEKKGDRVHVVYFAKKEQAGVQRTAWMKPDDLTYFAYDCTCDDKGKCSPLLRHFATSEWNKCFKEGRDKKLAELTSPQGTTPQPSGSKPLTNADVIALTKAGLGDEIVLSKVTAAPVVKFDTSVEALIALKKEGVGKPVIDAMVKQPDRVASVSAAPQSGPHNKRGKSVPASKVRVTSNNDAIKGCTLLGRAHGTATAGTVSEKVFKDLQTKASTMGGNVVLLMGQPSIAPAEWLCKGCSMMQGDGEVYSCPDE